ncbi:MAG TPA: hypothetical protein VHD32_12990 [Candidatus Didemnitutus sp.]|nr:hypothetical protein [Candidatus Didemnitutus sp.]
MKTRVLATLLAFGALISITGCQSVDSRIKEKPEVFAHLDPETQAKLKQGIIDIGYTEDMVYIALGRPDQKRETVTAQGRTVTWIYNTYYETYEDAHYVGYYRHVYFDPYLNSYRLYYRHAFPATVVVEQKDERIRIVFKDGKAAVIEQAKD